VQRDPLFSCAVSIFSPHRFKTRAVAGVTRSFFERVRARKACMASKCRTTMVRSLIEQLAKMNPDRVERSRVRRLTDLPNIGPSLADDLRLIGIDEPG
jgi:hypothetical protein